jgi:hypothetical protein
VKVNPRIEQANLRIKEKHDYLLVFPPPRLVHPMKVGPRLKEIPDKMNIQNGTATTLPPTPTALAATGLASYIGIVP